MSVCFLVVDLVSFAANLLKIRDGGWFPLTLGADVLFLPMTWCKGKRPLHARSLENGIPLEPFLAGLLARPSHRVEGMAVLLIGNTEFVPISLLYNLKRDRALHKRVIFTNLATRGILYVDDKYRASVRGLGNGIYIIEADYGFKKASDVYRVLELGQSQVGIRCGLMDTLFFIVREPAVPSRLPGMSMWHECLSVWTYQNGAKPPDFFRVPTNRVVELGIKVEV